MSPDDFAHSVDLIVAKIVVARQIDRALVKRIAHLVFRPILKHRQHAEWPEEDASVDIVRSHVVEQRIAVEEYVTVDDDSRHPVAVQRALRFDIERQRKIAQARLIGVHDRRRPSISSSTRLSCAQPSAAWMFDILYL